MSDLDRVFLVYEFTTNDVFVTAHVTEEGAKRHVSRMLEMWGDAVDEEGLYYEIHEATLWP